MLEDGQVDEADRKKDIIEEIQRERRKELSKRGEEHVPRFFKWVHFFDNPDYRWFYISIYKPSYFNDKALN